jgi:hypothetical protein
MSFIKRLSQKVDKVHEKWDQYEDDFLSTQMQTSYFDFAALPSDVDLDDYLSALGKMGLEERDYHLSHNPKDVDLKQAIAVEMITARAIADSHLRFQSYAGQSEDFNAFMQAFRLAAPKEGSGLYTITRDVTGGHFIGHQPMADFSQKSYKNIIAYNPKKVPVAPDLSAIPVELDRALNMQDLQNLESTFANKVPFFDMIRVHEAVHSIQFATVPALHARFANSVMAPQFLTMHARTDMRTRYLYEVDAYFKMSYLTTAVQGYEQNKETMEHQLAHAKEQAKGSAPIDVETFKRAQAAQSLSFARTAKRIAAFRGETVNGLADIAGFIQDYITVVELDEQTIRQIGASGTGGRYNTFTENFEPDAPIRAEFLQLTFPLMKGLRSKFAEKVGSFIGGTPQAISEIFKNPDIFLQASKGAKDQLSMTTHAALHRAGYEFKPPLVLSDDMRVNVAVGGVGDIKPTKKEPALKL